RGIDGFSLALLEEYNDKLDPKAQDYLARVRKAAQRMGALIDDLLNLSRVGRAEIHRGRRDRTALALPVARGIPHRNTNWAVPVGGGRSVDCDPRLLRVVFENLRGNAWKFSAKVPEPRVEVGWLPGMPAIFFVRDNGAGFDMSATRKLFAPFQRLHSEKD